MNELAAKISPAELEVLEVLWQADAPMPIASIRNVLAASHRWDASTVKTLLRRLCEKQAVAAEKREQVAKEQEFGSIGTENLTCSNWEQSKMSTC